MRSHEIRERFLRFFEERGHHVLPNASLIPSDDPSLLFTVAGMVPLKPYISGERTPPAARLVSCQKCFRGSELTTDDIASVGDCIHHTFFEMLGNWSIGDYFKQGAIELAWELLTQGFGLDPDRLWPSIYPDNSDYSRDLDRSDRRRRGARRPAGGQLVAGRAHRTLRLRQRDLLRPRRALLLRTG